MTDSTPNTEQSLSKRTISAALWSLFSRGGSQVLKLVSNLILTRLLYPEAFGIMGAAVGIMIMVQLFSDTGTRLSIIQNPRGNEPVFLNTAWVIGIIRGASLSLIMLGIAWPLALIYNKPALGWVMALLALTPLISSLENPSMVLLVRHMKGRRQVLYDFLPQICGFFLTIFFAWMLRSVWALLIGSLLVSTVKLAISYSIDDYRPSIIWDRESAKELVSFGKFVMLNTIIFWAATNLDTFVVGKMLGMDTLGIYNLGLSLGFAVELIVQQLLGNSYFPALSQVMNDRPRCARIFMKTLVTVVALAAPILVTQGLFGTHIISMLYDTRYLAAGTVLFWVSIRGIFRVVSLLSSSTIFAFGAPRCETVAMGVSLAVLLVLLPMGISRLGMTGALLAILFSCIAALLVECWYLVRSFGIPLVSFGVPALQAATVVTVSWGVFATLKPWLDGPRWSALPFMLVVLAASSAVSYAAWRLAQTAIPDTNRTPDRH